MVVEAPAAHLGFLPALAQREPEAVPVVLDTHDLERHDVALGEDLVRRVDAAVDQLRDVRQALDGPGQPREGAEGDDLRDDAGDDVADLVSADQVLPLLRRGAAHGERDLLVLAIDAHDEDIDLLADVEELLRVRVAVPGELGQVGEAVGPTEVDEDAEVADRGDLAAADFTLGELAQQALLLLGAPLLHGRALGKDGAVAAAVDLDHLHAQPPADLVGERVGAVAAGLGADDLRHGDEGVDALDVGEQAALVEARDFRLEDLAALEALLQDPPALFAARAVDRELDLAVLGLRLHDVDEHVLADAKPGERVGAERVHLLHGHDALGLRADVDEVDEDAVALDAHHRALDDLAATQLARFGRLAGVEQRAHVKDLFLFLFLGLGCGGGCGCDGRFRRGRRFWCSHCCGSAARWVGLLRGVGVRQGLLGPPVLGSPLAGRSDGPPGSRTIIARVADTLRRTLGMPVGTSLDAERAGPAWNRLA